MTKENEIGPHRRKHCVKITLDWIYLFSRCSFDLLQLLQDLFKVHK